jgi:transcriptional regulator with XRE-family HTH domain
VIGYIELAGLSLGRAMSTFGSRLKLCRRLEGMTREQLAKRVQCHVATIGRWERDQDMPSFITGCRLAKALQKHSFFLAGLIDVPTPGTQLGPLEDALVKSFRQMTPAQQQDWANYALDCHRVRQIETKAKSG